jgi:hypothetical protein
MIDETYHTYLVKWAGTDLMWENGPIGKFGPLVGARSNSAWKRGLREFIEAYANGQCVFCGTDTDGSGELCHIVASGPKRRGFVPGNIALGCYTCNREQVTRYGEIVPVSGIRYPHLVPSEWPTATALQNAGKAIGTRAIA